MVDTLCVTPVLAVIAAHGFEDDRLGRDAKGKDVVDFEVFGKGKLLAEGLVAESLDDAAAKPAFRGTEKKCLELDAVVTEAIGNDARVEALDEIGGRTFAGSRSVPIGEITCPRKVGENGGAGFRGAGNVVAEGLRIAP